MKKSLALIFLSALLIRMILIGAWYEWGRGDSISWDGGGYYALAKSLLAGKGFQWEDGTPTARRPPLYPVFIASLLPWSPFPLGVYIAQAFIGAFSCVALFGMGAILFDRRVGLGASVFMALDYMSVRQTVSVMAETLFVFLLILSFYCLMQGRNEKRVRWLIGAGLFSGLSVLTRDVYLFYYPLTVLWIFLGRGSWRVRFSRAAAFTLPLLLVIGPWALRNSLIAERPILITMGGPSVIYLSNNPTTTGGTTGGDWELGLDTSIPPGVYWPGIEISDPEWERHIMKQGLDFIRNNPKRFAELMGRKIVNMWRPYQTDSPFVSRWATALTYLPVVVFGLYGMLCQLKHWREFFPIFSLVVYAFALHAVLMAHMRYRLPVMPFFMVFAAFALLKFWDRVKLTQLEKVKFPG